MLVFGLLIALVPKVHARVKQDKGLLNCVSPGKAPFLFLMKMARALQSITACHLCPVLAGSRQSGVSSGRCLTFISNCKRHRKSHLKYQIAAVMHESLIIVGLSVCISFPPECHNYHHSQCLSDTFFPLNYLYLSSCSSKIVSLH